MSTTFDLGKYFETVQKPVHVLSVAAFFWDVGKTLIEGWHSLGSFMLTLSLVIGWLMITTVLLPVFLIGLPIWIWILIVSLGTAIFRSFHPNPDGTTLLPLVALVFIWVGWAALGASSTNRKYFDFMFDVFFRPRQSWGVWTKRIPYLYFSITAALGIIVSSTIELSEDNAAAIRIVGWVGLFILVSSLASAIDLKKLVQWRAH
jgi:hypothetical protein